MKKGFMDLKKFTHSFTFTQKQVERFAEVTGDNNPIHLDEKYASQSIFKKRIIHGFLAGSVFSKVFGTMFPGEGTIYLNQKLIFLRPMYVEHNYVANFEINETDEMKGRAKVRTYITDQNNRICLDGEALIQHSSFKKPIS